MPSKDTVIKAEPSLTRKELVSILARKTGTSKRISGIMIGTLEELITTELKAGRNLTLSGVGTFYSIDRTARKGIDPNTKKEIKVPSMRLPKFRPGINLRKALRTTTSKKDA